jgi:hypothetical protein
MAEKRQFILNEYAAVIVLAALVAIVGWRVMVLVGPDVPSPTPGKNVPSASVNRPADSGPYVIYDTYRVIDRGDKSRMDDDKLAYDFRRYALADGRSESIAEIVADGAKAFGSPWMRPLSDHTLLFVRRYTSSDDFLWVDAAGKEVSRPASGQITNVSGLPSPDGSMVAYADERSAAVSIVSADGSDPMFFSTKGFISTGYLSPVVWSAENDAVFLKPVFDGGTAVAGLWYADLGSKVIKEYSVVRKLGLADFVIYPTQDKIVGTTFSDGGLESGALGPSKIYLIDIPTGRSTVLQSDEIAAFRDPLLSPDGRRLAFSFGSGEPDVWMVDTGETDPERRSIISGRPLAWTPDGRSLAVSRDNELQIVDVGTGRTSTIVRRSGKYQDQDFQGVEFIGIIKDKEQ